MEIERKFLVIEIPDLTGVKHDKIVQGYISFSPESRIRKKGERYFHTQKGEEMIVREEIENEVSSEQGKALFERVISNLIEKTRYYIPLGKFTAELDIYEGKFKGLVVVEVEFESLDEANSFTPPYWFGQDISENMEYRNKILATKD